MCAFVLLRLCVRFVACSFACVLSWVGKPRPVLVRFLLCTVPAQYIVCTYKSYHHIWLTALPINTRSGMTSG